MTAKKKTNNKAAAPNKVRGAATADAILGTAPVRGSKEPPVNIKPEWLKYYHRLLELREQLLKQRNGLARESAQELPSYSLHMADTGTDNFDRDFALSLLSSDQDALYEIEAALKRIEKNTYGICELTGKPIPKARLDAIPWTRYTVEAQAQLERSGMAKQRRLAALGSLDFVAPAEPESSEEEGEDKLRDKE
ncbi:MAG: TraR/DksA C4-type zinc finger protein [Verrucomicrobiota bacterium]|nr:TraR/DksA C4-type zinc finger protein [Limisphaera sp.]MDW8381168.1 TraR/DksA C4-type zinc finger protein [Verrucomicrobiota bacterium]